jgi:hypothetical protein
MLTINYTLSRLLGHSHQLDATSLSTRLNPSQPVSTRLNTMASHLPLLIEDGTPLDFSQWRFGQLSKGKYTSNAYVNESAVSRNNPRFQIHVRLRVKHIPSPGQEKTIQSHPYERVNIECAVPRGYVGIHDWFRSWDLRGTQFTFENQGLVWPGKRPKAVDDILAEGLFRTSIVDTPRMVEKGWEPSLRLKGVPLEGMKDGNVVKNKKPTRVYVVEVDSNGKRMRDGLLSDIELGDEIVASVDVEGWWGSKDGSGITYRIDECAVYKPSQRPTTCQLRMDGDMPIVKRVRNDPDKVGAEAAATAATNSNAGSSDALDIAEPEEVEVAESEVKVKVEDDGAMSEEEGF